MTGSHAMFKLQGSLANSQKTVRMRERQRKRKRERKRGREWKKVNGIQRRKNIRKEIHSNDTFFSLLRQAQKVCNGLNVFLLECLAISVKHVYANFECLSKKTNH